MTGSNPNAILNDPKEFEKFFREKYRQMCLIACRYVKDMETAEEVVQEIFVKIWEKREQLTITGSMGAYLTISVKNHCINYLKHQTIVSNYEKAEALKFSIDPSQGEEEMGDSEIEDAVMNAISELPPQRQKIFALSRVDGLKYHEIAEKLGLSIKTVEAQMGLALKQLREKLKDYLTLLIILAKFL